MVLSSIWLGEGQTISHLTFSIPNHFPELLHSILFEPETIV
jgi:hypothetical protein